MNAGRHSRQDYLQREALRLTKREAPWRIVTALGSLAIAAIGAAFTYLQNVQQDERAKLERQLKLVELLKEPLTPNNAQLIVSYALEYGERSLLRPIVELAPFEIAIETQRVARAWGQEARGDDKLRQYRDLYVAATRAFRVDYKDGTVTVQSSFTAVPHYLVMGMNVRTAADNGCDIALLKIPPPYDNAKFPVSREGAQICVDKQCLPTDRIYRPGTEESLAVWAIATRERVDERTCVVGGSDLTVNSASAFVR